MIASLTAALVENPILTLFVVIGLGYLVGEISLFGFRFGVAGVLFVGLAAGSLSPNVGLPEFVSSLGLIIFVYTIGIHSGPAFFESFQRRGWRDGMLAGGVLAGAAALTVLLAWVFRLPAAKAAGLYCGALTNTPALAALRERLRENGRADLSELPVVAYSIAYPIGVIGVLLAFQIARRAWRVEFQPAREAAEILARDFEVVNPAVVNKTIAEALGIHKEPGFVISRIRHQGQTDIASASSRLCAGDIVAAVGDEESLERAEQIFGAPSPTRITEDRSVLDYRRIFVSSPETVGKRVRDLDLQNRFPAIITRLRRGDVDVVPDPETRLESGDIVRVLTRRENFEAVSRFFGDSIRGTAETDFLSVALGMVLGVLVGAMPIPLPGGPTVRLGFAGGPLLVALMLGWLERTGRITWTIPVSANFTLRQIGLLLFLAGVGTRAGYSFTTTIRDNGLQMLLAGAIITMGATLGTLLVGHRYLRIPFDSLMGLISGLQTQPACLAYATNMSKTEAPNLAYAGVYPFAMIAKIILAQLLVSGAAFPAPPATPGQKFVPADVDAAHPVYATSFETPAVLKDWALEGGLRMSVAGGNLVLESKPGSVQSEAGANHLVCWLRREIPADFLLEFTVQPENRKQGLNIVFFSTRGLRGESIFDPSLAPRNGYFSQYHSGDLNGYHISYWAAGRGTAHIRKNQGFHMAAAGQDLVTGGAPGAFQTIRIYKRGGIIRLMVDGVVSVAWDDDGRKYGPVWTHPGWIGLRQMGHTVRCRYGELKVFPLLPRE